MNISANAIYQSDCLALLERIESGQVTLAYIDAPPFPPMELPIRFSKKEDSEEILKKLETESLSSSLWCAL